MRHLVLGLVLSVLFAVVCAQLSPAEQRWKREEAATGNEILDILIPLKQRNLEQLHALVADLTNPSSPNFAQWWNKQQILDLVAPEKAVAESVAHFLLKAGFISVDISNRDSIKARADVATLSNVFSTKFHNYRLDKDVKGEKRIVRAIDGYTIPAEIAEHVEFVSGIEELPFPSKKKPVAPFIRNIASVGTVDPGYVVPDTIMRLYNISDIPTNKNSSLCLAEFQDDASFSKEDNKKFITEAGAHPFDVVKIVGPYQPQEPDGESSLDVQYGGATGLGTNVWFWTVNGWMLEFSTDLSNADEFPLVVSMSWGWPEMWQCAGSSPPGNCKGMSNQEYISRVNAEFAKSVARGVTLLASSGDTGAPGDVNPDCDDRKDPISNSFPASSPYVTSVGATMLAKASATAPAEEPPICKKYSCSTSDSELVCTYPDALITTGGGFSTYITQPTWQTDAVNGYLGSGVALPPSNTFNKGGRAYPDVSALGHNYLVLIGGQWTPVDGTSCSSPVMAGMVALINSARMNAGKTSIGHLAPILYQAATHNAAIFHDQTTGNNKCTEDCCAKVGFEATKGWDPVTGLGSPNFGLLLDYINTLP